MRSLFLFLVFTSVLFSVYYEPPIDSVNSFNGIRAGELSDSFNESAAKGELLTFSWYGRYIVLNASMRIAGLTLLIDNATSAGHNARVIVEHGEEMGHLVRKGSVDGFYCDRDWFDGHGDDSACDFDVDGCAEYEYSSDIFNTIEITFIFGNMSETVRANEETVTVFDRSFRNAVTNTVSIPESIEQAMENASGADNLTIIMNGSATFVYGIDNRTSGGLACISRYSAVSRTISFSANRTYTVEGRNKLFFTTAPVLNEQWFRNNRFDNIVLSQSRIYEAEILMNNESVANFSLFGFNITENQFGIQEIISVPLNDSEIYVGVVNVTPSALDVSTRTYAFLYQFNHSYEGLGENELELSVKDFFEGEGSSVQKILSRQLSYHSNKTELGTEYDPSTTRKSVSVGSETLRVLEIGVGMLGILVILLLIPQIRK